MPTGRESRHPPQPPWQEPATGRLQHDIEDEELDFDALKRMVAREVQHYRGSEEQHHSELAPPRTQQPRRDGSSAGVVTHGRDVLRG